MTEPKKVSEVEIEIDDIELSDDFGEVSNGSMETPYGADLYINEDDNNDNLSVEDHQQVLECYKYVKQAYKDYITLKRAIIQAKEHKENKKAVDHAKIERTKLGQKMKVYDNQQIEQFKRFRYQLNHPITLPEVNKFLYQTEGAMYRYINEVVTSINLPTPANPTAPTSNLLPTAQQEELKVIMDYFITQNRNEEEDEKERSQIAGFRNQARKGYKEALSPLDKDWERFTKLNKVYIIERIIKEETENQPIITNSAYNFVYKVESSKGILIDPDSSLDEYNEFDSMDTNISNYIRSSSENEMSYIRLVDQLAKEYYRELKSQDQQPLPPTQQHIEILKPLFFIKNNILFILKDKSYYELFINNVQERLRNFTSNSNNKCWYTSITANENNFPDYYSKRLVTLPISFKKYSYDEIYSMINSRTRDKIFELNLKKNQVPASPDYLVSMIRTLRTLPPSDSPTSTRQQLLKEVSENYTRTDTIIRLVLLESVNKFSQRGSTVQWGSIYEVAQLFEENKIEICYDFIPKLFRILKIEANKVMEEYNKTIESQKVNWRIPNSGSIQDILAYFSRTSTSVLEAMQNYTKLSDALMDWDMLSTLSLFDMLGVDRHLEKDLKLKIGSTDEQKMYQMVRSAQRLPSDLPLKQLKKLYAEYKLKTNKSTTSPSTSPSTSATTTSPTNPGEAVMENTTVTTAVTLSTTELESAFIKLFSEQLRYQFKQDSLQTQVPLPEIAKLFLEKFKADSKAVSLQDKLFLSRQPHPLPAALTNILSDLEFELENIREEYYKTSHLPTLTANIIKLLNSLPTYDNINPPAAPKLSQCEELLTQKPFISMSTPLMQLVFAYLIDDSISTDLNSYLHLPTNAATDQQPPEPINLGPYLEAIPRATSVSSNLEAIWYANEQPGMEQWQYIYTTSRNRGLINAVIQDNIKEKLKTALTISEVTKHIEKSFKYNLDRIDNSNLYKQFGEQESYVLLNMLDTLTPSGIDIKLIENNLQYKLLATNPPSIKAYLDTKFQDFIFDGSQGKEEILSKLSQLVEQDRKQQVLSPYYPIKLAYQTHKELEEEFWHIRNTKGHVSRVKRNTKLNLNKKAEVLYTKYLQTGNVSYLRDVDYDLVPYELLTSTNKAYNQQGEWCKEEILKTYPTDSDMDLMDSDVSVESLILLLEKDYPNIRYDVPLEIIKAIESTRISIPKGMQEVIDTDSKFKISVEYM